MEYDIYFDESGDLGWILNQPYRKGGSSQFFTIAYLLLPTNKNKLITRFIKKFHKERKGKEIEIKGATFRNVRAKSMARKIVDLLKSNPDFVIGSVTVKKYNVPIRIKNDRNADVLYNHLVQLGLCSKISKLTKVNIIPDERSVPRGSQNSCSDLLKLRLWLELDSNVIINYQPEESHQNTRLIFIDWVANFIWRHYEDNNSDAYHVLKPWLAEHLLLF